MSFFGDTEHYDQQSIGKEKRKQKKQKNLNKTKITKFP